MISLADLRAVLGPHGRCKLTWDPRDGFILSATRSDGTVWVGRRPPDERNRDDAGHLEGLVARCIAALSIPE